MSLRRHSSRASRVGIAAVLLVASAFSFAGRAAGQETLSDLKARMDDIQGQLDATTMKIEDLRDETERLHQQITDIEARRSQLRQETQSLVDAAVARANELYRSGSVQSLEVLFSSEDFGELADRAEMLSQVSLEDAGVFTRLSRTRAQLSALTEDLTTRESNLDSTTDQLRSESERLREQFRSVASEWQRLRRKLAAVQPSTPDVGTTASSSAPVKVHVSGNMTCPVAGPVSFTDTWGAPRDGHTHQGVDMMADYGTPIVAITSGTASYVAYDGSGGNMIFLDGDDGNSYWYMHNQENYVHTGQHVQVGEQIAEVGDTGNAVGTPHLHFEFHPGGGEAVNPTPLVASLC